MMILYFVQLETKDATYQFEVFTKDFDAVGRARDALASEVGEAAAAVAHCGGSGRIGEDRFVTEPSVRLTLKHNYTSGVRKTYA